ncbi:MAG TPA: hypothetical protein PLP33_27205 [Leptospiraceae bacterium]|nr:hypothetical protein [Leptospiraceae bacterium]
MKEKTYELIKDAESLFNLRIEESTGEFFGLLCPPNDGSIFPYQSPVLGIYSKIAEEYTIIVIHSIDDSGLTLWFAGKDRKLLDRFREFLSLEADNKFVCPNKEEIENFCNRNGGYADYW